MSSADQYDACGASLSQGDIVETIPFGFIPSPLTLYRKANSALTTGQAKFGTTTDLERAFNSGIESIEARAGRGIAIVLWADCQIDKFLNQGRPVEKWFAGVAPIFSARRLGSERQRENLFAGKKKAFFPLHAYPEAGVSDDSYVDLRQIWSVSQTLLTNRRATLSVRGRDALYDHLLLFLTDRQLSDKFECPKCGESSPASALLSQHGPREGGDE